MSAATSSRRPVRPAAVLFVACSFTAVLCGADSDVVTSPAVPVKFTPNEFTLPDGVSSQLAAGPPLVTHPTMGCFDDRGRLFVCNNAGVNMSADELEKNLPNSINMLEDHNGDGVFDRSTVFADKMTFPMGGAWHNGALYVASPPNIWRLEDTDGDGVADKRDIIVDSFGYTGNAASIHGCFFSPAGRLYWCDGYHGHEFKDEDGNIVSKRKGSYIFSCWPDGSDVRIHCGGGMDNPVELDFTEEGDVIGTVNILYTRPRVDCLVHWQYGGAYPHREAVLDELKVTGEVLGPIHRFGHVAISGTTRYRSGAMDNTWRDNFFATEFNLGKVVRVELERSGSTYSCTEREFLSCSNRDFHPTDVIEDADGSLLVVDTGGWFYRGCPTSQIAKPDVLGGIYRIRRDDPKAPSDPRGLGIDWAVRTEPELMQDLQDTRFAVREQAIQECVRRGETIVDGLMATIRSAEVPARRNAIWAVTRIFQRSRNDTARTALLNGLADRDVSVRQAAWHGIGAAGALTPDDLKTLPETDLYLWKAAVLAIIGMKEESPAVRREACATLAALKAERLVQFLQFRNLISHPDLDREERHAFMYAVLESSDGHGRMKSAAEELFFFIASGHPEHLVVFDQMYEGGVTAEALEACISDSAPEVVQIAAQIVRRRLSDNALTPEEIHRLGEAAVTRTRTLLLSHDIDRMRAELPTLIQAFGSFEDVGSTIGELLDTSGSSAEIRSIILNALATHKSTPLHEDWQTPLDHLLRSADPTERVAAIRAAGNVGTSHFFDQLRTVATTETESVNIRTAALEAIIDDRRAMSEGGLFPLLVRLTTDGTIEEQGTAARLLSASSLSADQLRAVAPLLRNAGPQQLVDLVKLFKRSLTPDLAAAFLDNIEHARSLNSLPMLEVSEVVKRFPTELHARANTLLDGIRETEQLKVLKLDALVAELKSGDAGRGKDVFFSDKAKCATCHIVGDKGKRVGPDLTTIGANRTSKDFLESLIFPSATIVRQYEPYTVLTAAGRTYSGLVIRDASDAVTIQQSTGDPVRISRDEIEEIIPSTVSIMPKGLDEALTPQQIADMVAWMQTLRRK